MASRLRAHEGPEREAPWRAAAASAVADHWPEFLMEAALLGAFMVSACAFSVVLEHPASPARTALPDSNVRRALMGVAMGATAVALITSRWGKRSGAHINPATTLTFYRLGRVAGPDAAGYALAQFAGAVAGTAIAAVVLFGAAGHERILYAATIPGEGGAVRAFLAEAAISFVLMSVVLAVSNVPRWNRFTPLAAGACVALFIAVEAPLSGMSMNPARTFGSAVLAMRWDSIWIYLVAPPLGMLAAAEARVRLRGLPSVLCAKLQHENDERCIFRCGYRRRGPSRSGTEGTP
jgi:aquaporin Z